MWEKIYEMVNEHQTGRWQWFAADASTPGSGYGVPARITDGTTGQIYPGVWMFGDRICPPPNVGLCITKDLENKKMQARMSTR